MGDLKLSDEESHLINKALQDKIEQDTAIQIIKSKYLKGSPAHFGTADGSIQAGKNLTGVPENGKLIYENSCLHCHANRKYSYLLLDDSKLTFKHLACKADGYTNHSIYQVVRYGVYSKAGKRSYMPQYPMEKMSDQQLEDLRSYIEMRAE
jgi:mono/diheme cytochrome c family protein